ARPRCSPRRWTSCSRSRGASSRRRSRRSSQWCASSRKRERSSSPAAARPPRTRWWYERPTAGWQNEHRLDGAHQRAKAPERRLDGAHKRAALPAPGAGLSVKDTPFVFEQLETRGELIPAASSPADRASEIVASARAQAAQIESEARAEGFTAG